MILSALNTLLAADEPATNKNSWIMWVIIGVVLVLMIVLTIVPQKKRQKEQQKMMDAINVGTKIMTVGGIVGKITQVNSDNTLIVNVGTESSPTLIVIDRKAVGYVLEAVNAPAPAVEEPKTEEPATTNSADETPAEAPVEEAPVEETPAESAEAPEVPEAAEEAAPVEE